jgi:hypothetical protein
VLCGIYDFLLFDAVLFIVLLKSHILIHDKLMLLNACFGFVASRIRVQKNNDLFLQRNNFGHCFQILYISSQDSIIPNIVLVKV